MSYAIDASQLALPKLDDVHIVKGRDVRSVLDRSRPQVLEAVRQAYGHERADDDLPYAVAVRFGADRPERIMALPARVRAPLDLAGIKWVSSFPANVARGMDRASAVIVLTSVTTGRAVAVLDGTPISAARTGASAALAAHLLHRGPTDEIAVIGAGPVNFEVCRFVSLAWHLRRVVVCDLEPDRAAYFGRRIEEALTHAVVEVQPDLAKALASTRLVSFATSAVTPYVHDRSLLAPGTTVLHVSVRDLAPEIVLDVDNVVDDVDHVCQASTSVHLAEQASGHRRFIRCTLPDVIRGTAPPPASDVTVFSPFGLGTLDVAVAGMVLAQASEAGQVATIENFFGSSWGA